MADPNRNNTTNNMDSQLLMRHKLQASLRDVLSDADLQPPPAMFEPPPLPTFLLHQKRQQQAPLAVASPYFLEPSLAAAAAHAQQHQQPVQNPNLLDMHHARVALLQQQLIEAEERKRQAVEEEKKRLAYMALLQGQNSAVDPKGKDRINAAPVAQESMALDLLLRGVPIGTAKQNPAPAQVLPIQQPQAASLPSIQSSLNRGGHSAPVASSGFAKSSPNALEALGSSLRNKNDPYIDVSSLQDPDPKDSTVKRTRGGVSTPFPEKLHEMLLDVEKEGLTHIVSFYAHGRAFGVHDPDKFVSEVMPKYFKQSKWNSFARQLNLYGFIRIQSGPDAGGYYHELFLKGRPNLCFHMRRVGVPQGGDRRKLKMKQEAPDPDFYSMKPVTSTPPTAS